ncbi:MAG: TatD family hydrolase, partial [Neisseriaceae bacterium]|nr:TatD family hydrolase [Neisseriaceae bacterium]
LRQQLHIAQEYHRPISLHCVKAHNECITLIKKHKFNCGGFIHGFSGSLNIALEWIKLGFVIGIGTVLLKTNSTLRKIFAQLPANAWVLESDAPFMLPENTPAVIQQIAHTAAQLSQQSLVSIQQQSTQNTVQFLKRCEW